MKKLLFVISFVLLTGITGAFAQKFGYINSAELMQIMPGVDTVEARLNEHRASLEQQMNTMIQEYQTKAQKYQAEFNTMSDIIKETKGKEIQDLQNRIQQYQQTADADLQRKRVELFNPLIERAQKAVVDVAKENGFTYIFDISTGALAFYENGENIMDLVKAKLGIK